MDIKNSVFLVTGGASGLGAATARMAVANGAQGRHRRHAGRGGRDARQGTRRQRALRSRCDVTSEADGKAAVTLALKEFGGLHGAGQLRRHRRSPSARSARTAPHASTRFSRVISINLIGTFNVIRLAAEAMAKAEPNAAGERGVIVNTASVAAYDGQIGQAAYSASKGGVVGMTLPIARDLSRNGIRVCTIAPGIFDTPMLLGTAQGSAGVARQAGAVPLAPRQAGRVRAAGAGTSSRTRCSTARRSASTARSAWRPSNASGRIRAGVARAARALNSCERST